MLTYKSASKTLLAFALTLFTAAELYALNDDPANPSEVQKFGPTGVEMNAIMKEVGRTCYNIGQNRARLQSRLDSLRKIRNPQTDQVLQASKLEEYIALADQTCDPGLR